MGFIRYELTNVDNLANAAPQFLPGGGYTLATLPPGMVNMSGIYMIINLNQRVTNRYVGIASEFLQRFQPRLEVITELGLDSSVMRDISVIWGNTYTRDANNANWNVANVLRNQYCAMIHGWTINLEKLLIRLILTQLGGDGGTVSNNQFAGPNNRYSNPTGQDITVEINFASIPKYGPYQKSYIWHNGVSW